MFIDWYRAETQVHSYGKPCTEVAAHASKVMRCQPQPRENSNIERKHVSSASHTTGCLRSIRETYDTILQRDLSYSDEEIRIFYRKSIERIMSPRLMATRISASAYLSKIGRNILK